jgi:hypothetical protein
MVILRVMLFTRKIRKVMIIRIMLKKIDLLNYIRYIIDIKYY